MSSAALFANDSLTLLVLGHSITINPLRKIWTLYAAARPLYVAHDCRQKERRVRADWVFLCEMFLYSRSQSRKNNRARHE